MILNPTDRLAQPDGFIGALFAIEGVADATTLLNGPTGCKFPLGETSHDQYRRERAFDMMRWAEEFYFQQDRIPCTYLDDYDYVFGASEKLEYVFGRIAAKNPAFIGVVNSPGASLIGDDLQRYVRWAGLKVPWITLDVPAFSNPYAEGFAEGCLSVLAAIEPPPLTAEPATVNLLGLSLWHRHWKGSLAELRRLLGLCGIRVMAAPGAGSSVAELRQLRSAALNVVVHDEGGVPVATGLQQRWNLPFFRSSAGAPVGFEATSAWLSGLCETLGVDPQPGLSDLARQEEKAAEKIYRFHQKSGLPKGVSFGVALDASLAWPLTRWLHSFLGMVPQVVQLPEETSPSAIALHRYLNDNGCGDAWNAPLTPESPPVAVFADDAVILRCNAQKKVFAGIDLAMPAKDRTHFFERCVLGGEGARWILQQLIDELWRMVDV